MLLKPAESIVVIKLMEEIAKQTMAARIDIGKARHLLERIGAIAASTSGNSHLAQHVLAAFKDGDIHLWQHFLEVDRQKESGRSPTDNGCSHHAASDLVEHGTEQACNMTGQNDVVITNRIGQEIRCLRRIVETDDLLSTTKIRFRLTGQQLTFSGKDASKVDRSAAYATRHIAKNLVAAGLCDEALVQVAYAIGVAEPVGLYVNTYGTAKVKMSDGEIATRVKKLFDLRPYAIVERFGLKNPIFRPTAAYGHIGRDPYKDYVTVFDAAGRKRKKKVQFFGWEELDMVDTIRKEFNLQ